MCQTLAPIAIVEVHPARRGRGDVEVPFCRPCYEATLSTPRAEEARLRAVEELADMRRQIDEMPTQDFLRRMRELFGEDAYRRAAGELGEQPGASPGNPSVEPPGTSL